MIILHVGLLLEPIRVKEKNFSFLCIVTLFLVSISLVILLVQFLGLYFSAYIYISVKVDS
jgi:hypothetical protein